MLEVEIGWRSTWEISTAVPTANRRHTRGGVRSVVINGYAVAIVTIEGAPLMLIGSLLSATGLLFGVPTVVWVTVAVLAVVGVVAFKMRKRRRR
ncbi:hypothetical protein [Amycolatopsis sp. BJA-103]|uniref:hypothetical protein n=1 Tax=Amycolatopsis sp. BJA-103 TaxID=1911175 RepID=UPI0011AF402B|nr:hypothetical protein [Amycolatopsis sp. BJA-103]